MVSVPFFILAYMKDKHDEEQKRIEELTSDYPGIISKLSLLYGAGMTIYASLEKICSDYEKSSGFTKDRLIYQELKLTCSHIKNGCSESREYILFGQRCKAGCFIKLGNLLSRNLLKGSSDLLYILNEEVIWAYEEKRQFVIKKSGEASTKLLLPMMMIFIIILIIIMIPALSSVSLN